MNLLYNIGIFLFTALANLLAPFNSKASLLVKGRRKWDEKIRTRISPGDRAVWIHCASLGEFEQGRPVIEAIRKKVQGLKVVLTFFSPSGYEIRKNYSEADCVIYLPADTRANAVKLIGLVNPEFVIFVKYEFWNNYISVLHDKGIPLYLISAIFRPGQHFFRWYGSFFRAMLRKFTRIFVQDKVSMDLLSGIGIREVVVAGDTRFDRVIQVAGAAREIQQLESFRGAEKLFLAGSSWWQDQEIITRYINKFPGKMKWVFAPHEIDVSNIDRLEKLLNVKSVRFSRYEDKDHDARVLIIDNIGMLSSAYRYAYLAAIGGGFGKGIHNILEPASWGIPVMFGPEFSKFREAVELIKEKAAMTFNSFEDFSDIIDNWLTDELFYLKSAKTAADYIKKNTGATPLILQIITTKDINKLNS